MAKLLTILDQNIKSKQRSHGRKSGGSSVMREKETEHEMCEKYEKYD